MQMLATSDPLPYFEQLKPLIEFLKQFLPPVAVMGVGALTPFLMSDELLRTKNGIRIILMALLVITAYIGVIIGQSLYFIPHWPTILSLVISASALLAIILLPSRKANSIQIARMMLVILAILMLSISSSVALSLNDKILLVIPDKHDGDTLSTEVHFCPSDGSPPIPLLFHRRSGNLWKAVSLKVWQNTGAIHMLSNNSLEIENIVIPKDIIHNAEPLHGGQLLNLTQQ